LKPFNRPLGSGGSGSLRWTHRGETSGRIKFRITQDSGALILYYRTRKNGEAWQPITLPVPLEATPCRYGGVRQYFLCPDQGCRRRCEVLYLNGVYFLCRKCCRYLYPSQKGNRLDKLVEARLKVGARIFEDWDGSGGWRKRKGMHWRTFERDRQTYEALEAAWSRAFCNLTQGKLGEGWPL